MSKHETGTETKQTTGAVSTHETDIVTKQTTGAVSTYETGNVTKQTTGAVSKHETGTVTKQTTGAVSKHETGTVTKQTTGAVSKHEIGTMTKQTTGAVSKHETGGTVTKQTTGARGGFAGAVFKHETGTVTKQTTGARGGFASLRTLGCHKLVIPVGTLKFERSKVCIRTENHTSANTSRSFVPWEAGGPSPNQHTSATPPRIWNIPIYGANIAAGLSGQRERCS